MRAFNATRLGSGATRPRPGVFQGPFDLLLTLILKEEISIFEVSLSDIVISYLERLEAEEEFDLDAASEFLILMSALLEIK